MWVRALLLLLVFVAGAAHAQELPSPDLIASDSRYLADLPGPDGRAPRGLTIWRAPSTPGVQLLPTLYVADGARGVYLAAARLRGPIEARQIPPIQIIGLDPHPNTREEEYGRVGRARYRAHERWVLDVVIPWAERVARASPQHRVIAGYSNGGDFALAMAADHPDIFSGVLAHSAVSTQRLRLDARAANVRWVVTAGRIEMSGYAAAAQSVARIAVREQGGALRICTGDWGHDYTSWVELTPGSVAWMFGFPETDVATPLEREACTNTERH
jgi:hypothetical protein